jgi:D-cysteine desulfhydrase
MRAEVLALAARCAALAGGPAPTESDLHLIDAIGSGFGSVSDADRHVMQLALDTEGILLDPTYGAKAMAALPATGGPVVLWLTGGLPGALKGWPA